MAALAVALMASPGRADDPAGELCTLTNCSGIDFGTPRGRPDLEPYSEPKRCRECELETLRRLNDSIANMEHPKPVGPLADTRSILGEDVILANAGLITLTAGRRLASFYPPASLVLNSISALMLLNSLEDARQTVAAGGTAVPVWLNRLSFSRPASKPCAELVADARAACAGASPAGCEQGEDCKTLLAKRAPLLDCDRAYLEVKKKDCPGLPDSDRGKMEENLADVKKCGRLIGQNPACCPDEVTTQKKKTCKSSRRGDNTCNEQNSMTLASLTSLSGPSVSALCASALANQTAANACRAARMAEAEQCYGRQLDAGHVEALNLMADVEEGCAAFLRAARSFRLCP